MRRKTKRSPAEAERRRLMKKLDAVCRLWARAQYPECVTCAKPRGPLQCGHLFSRVALSTRWDQRNLYTQCAGCNYRHEYDPYPLMRYAEYVWGPGIIDELHREYRRPRKWSIQELRELLAEYEAELAEGVT